MKNWMDRFYDRLDTLGQRMENKEFHIPVDLTIGILFFLFAGVVLLIIPDQVAVSERDVINGRAFPTLLISVMMVCCAALVVKELYKIAKKQPLQWKTVNLLVEVKALIILAILVITYILSRATGFFVIGAVFCSLAFLIYFRCSKPGYYAITLAIAVGIWAVFRFLLNVRF